MTVSSSTNRNDYTGNGSTTSFAVSFRFLENSHIKATLRDALSTETLQVETTDYTLTGAGGAGGGTLVMIVAPPSGTTLTIQRDVPATQETDYVENDEFPAESHEDALDKLTMLVQQQGEDSTRHIGFSDTVSDATGSAVELSQDATQRADTFLGFDSAGNIVTKTASVAGLVDQDQQDKRYSPIIATVAAMTAANPVALDGKVVSPVVGMVIGIVEYVAGNGSGLMIGSIVAGGTGTDDGGTYIDLDNGLQWRQNFSGAPYWEQYGAIGDNVADDRTEIDAAITANLVSRGKSKTYNIGDSTLVLNKSFSIIGDKKADFDYTGLVFRNGTVLRGKVTSTTTENAIEMTNIAIDSQGTFDEGLIISGTGLGTPTTTVKLQGVSAVGDANNNHAILVEDVENAYIDDILTIGTPQGLAVKAVNAFIGKVQGVDNTTWAFTLRFSPLAPASNVSIKEILSYTENNATSGGVICMNSQQGAALENVSFGTIKILNGSSGIFVDNQNNTVPAENITFDDVYIEGVSGFAFQTFDPCHGVKVRKAHFKDCGGSFNMNSALCNDHEYDHITLENTPAAALFFGADHKVSDWKFAGSTGIPATLISNSSTNLVVHDLDPRTGGVVNGGSGSVLPASTAIPANGSLPAMKSTIGAVVSDRKVGAVTNDVFAIWTSPNTRSAFSIRVVFLNSAGTFVRNVSIARDDIQYLASNTGASAVFVIQKTGNVIELKYISVTTSDIAFNAVVDVIEDS